MEKENENDLLLQMNSRLKHIEEMLTSLELVRRRQSSSKQRVDKIRTQRHLSNKQLWIATFIRQYHPSCHTAKAFSKLIEVAPDYNIKLGTFRSYISVLENSGLITTADDGINEDFYVLDPENEWVEEEVRKFIEENPNWEQMN